jgi:F-type H+-transporting ATPase subunit c
VVTGSKLIKYLSGPELKFFNKKFEKGVMMKRFTTVILGILLVLVLAPLAMAAEQAATGGTDYSKAIVVGSSVLAAGLVLGIGACGTGLGMGQATSGSSNAVGRNPEAQGKIMLTMMVGMAMTESIAIYALVISLIILYANPLFKVMGY